MDERVYDDIKELKCDVKDLDDRVTSTELKQGQTDILLPQFIENQKEFTKSNNRLADTMNEVKLTMQDMQHSIADSNKEISAMKADISNIKDAVEDEKESRQIDINEVCKEDAKKKLTTGQGLAIGGGSIGVVYLLIEVIKSLIALLAK